MKCTGANLADATKFSSIIDQVFIEFDVNTKLRKAMFLAQIGHESGGLHRVKEIWGPTETQKGYEGRTDLGNTIPGDGKKFMGRGLLQVTGRVNYLKIGKALNLDLISSPELLEQPLNAARSAGYFWKFNNLNSISDTGDIKLATKRINGGYNGLSERTTLYTRALSVLE